jgi:hypothetical protein
LYAVKFSSFSSMLHAMQPAAQPARGRTGPAGIHQLLVHLQLCDAWDCWLAATCIGTQKGS